MSGIFICYRREGAGYVGRLFYDRLVQVFGSDQIFMDVDKIAAGQPFGPIIEQKIFDSKVFLCLIDTDWLTCEDKNDVRRLDDEKDFVRQEIAFALKSHSYVIPILLQNVEMPRGDQLPSDLDQLSGLNAVTIRHEGFNSDMANLIESIQKEMSKSCAPPEAPLEFADVPAGIFQMGSHPIEQGRYNDEEWHKVSIAAFAITKYPVTFDQYDYFAEKTKRQKPDDNGWNRGKRPVINISANEALEYAAWLSKEHGQRYRLPTEAEWEYAARAGTETPFHFGDTIDTDQANFGNHDAKTVEVGQYEANKWGLYDVHGNVWEWTCSEYGENYGGMELKCADNKEKKWTIRGGSWKSERQLLRSAARVNERPNLQRNDLGFRLVRAEG